VDFEPDPLLCSLSIDALPQGKRPQHLGYGFQWLRATDESFNAARAWHFRTMRAFGSIAGSDRPEPILIEASDRAKG
jgi:hypothetical protein